MFGWTRLNALLMSALIYLAKSRCLVTPILGVNLTILRYRNVVPSSVESSLSKMPVVQCA